MTDRCTYEHLWLLYGPAGWRTYRAPGEYRIVPGYAVYKERNQPK